MAISDYRNTRRIQYQYRSENYSFMDDWRKNPYTFLKSRFYIECSVVLVTILLRTKIHPNTVTAIYGALGLIGGVLIAIPFPETIIAGILIFFVKGIWDWADGHLARATGRTSITGTILDPYGAHLNDLGLQIGLGFYVVFSLNIPLALYFIPFVPFCYAANLIFYSQRLLFSEIAFSKPNEQFAPNSKVDSSFSSNEEINKNSLGAFFGLYRILENVLDARARGVDFVCFVILLEIYTDISLSWMFFGYFVFRGAVFFAGSVYLVLNRDWIEHTWVSANANLHSGDTRR